jgi:hypothetical protein
MQCQYCGESFQHQTPVAVMHGNRRIGYAHIACCDLRSQIVRFLRGLVQAKGNDVSISIPTT